MHKAADVATQARACTHIRAGRAHTFTSRREGALSAIERSFSVCFACGTSVARRGKFEGIKADALCKLLYHTWIRGLLLCGSRFLAIAPDRLAAELVLLAQPLPLLAQGAHALHVLVGTAQLLSKRSPGRGI